MKKIASFRIDHTKLDIGIYVSRVDGYPLLRNVKATTFDIRVKKPYVDKQMDGNAMHTIEHLGASFLRSHRSGKNIIYFGPMGCATGFYLVAFLYEMDEESMVDIVKEMFKFIADFPKRHKTVPGATKKECGNYRYHSLSKAAKIASDFLGRNEWRIKKYE